MPCCTFTVSYVLYVNPILKCDHDRWRDLLSQQFRAKLSYVFAISVDLSHFELFRSCPAY